MKSDTKKAFDKLISRAAKLDALKERIRICVIRFRWKHLHHPWLKIDEEFALEERFDHLNKTIILVESIMEFLISQKWNTTTKANTTTRYKDY